tara:strand:+ start:1028 stop:1708 length:681 start_codon:yes stop_codon:yes gene_type:complete
MKVKIDTHEPEDFLSINDSKSYPLREGDFLIEVEGKRVILERKTWDDAYTSWSSKRLEDQISRMIENYDDCILIIEGKWNQSYTWRKGKNYSRIKGLQTFLNRISVEAVPVVYTDSKNDTMKYIEGLVKRIESGDYKMLVRKTTVVKSSRNKYHNIMSLIPGITIDRSKILYNHFNSLEDFIMGVERAKEVDDKKRWHTQVNKIEAFIKQEWGETKEREVIIDKND